MFLCATISFAYQFSYFYYFLFEKFDITLISMKSVNQSHIRAASLVTKRDCIGPNWSRLWALFPIRPLSRLTSEIVSTQLGCGAQLKRCGIGLTSLSGGRDYPRKKGTSLDAEWQHSLFAVKLLVLLSKIERKIFDPAISLPSPRCFASVAQPDEQSKSFWCTYNPPPLHTGRRIKFSSLIYEIKSIFRNDIRARIGNIFHKISQGMYE